ncbi:AAA family ATPase [Streptomyces sp. NPDC005303]|uniref:AAA family ATPase n=1 Tax=Streptomyces sp. NPDC005303 TaxID=3155713 RepID=UPI0033B38163
MSTNEDPRRKEPGADPKTTATTSPPSMADATEWVAASIDEVGTDETIRFIVALLDIAPERHDALTAAYQAHPKVQRLWNQFRADHFMDSEPSVSEGYSGAALKSEAQKVATAPEGTRNMTLNEAAFALGTLAGAAWTDLTAEAVEDALTEAAALCGLPPWEVAATIRSGLNAGMREPRSMPEGAAPVPGQRQAPPSVTVRPGAAERQSGEANAATSRRTISLKPASEIKIRPVHWLWKDRLPLGCLSLVAGREGIGKSTCAYQVAADITTAKLPGCYQGQPRAVIVAATEDSWEHTIAPRLKAAGADMDRVLQVTVTTAEGGDGSLTLPSDVSALGRRIEESGAALLLLDPLMSRLDASLDSHRDSEVRQALEPIAALADRHRISVLGLIHVNKSTGADPLTRIMASRAFVAVSRAVLYIMTDPENEAVRLLGQPKNNLGRTDLPTLTFSIEQAHVADTDEGPVFTGRLKWLGETERSITDALADADGDLDARSAAAEAGDWLADHLTQHGGIDDSASIKTAARKAGHSESTLKRARRRLKIVSTSSGFPRRTYWSLPGTQPGESAGRTQLGQSPGESGLTGLTDPTGPTERQSGQTPREAGLTGQLSIPGD